MMTIAAIAIALALPTAAAPLPLPRWTPPPCSAVECWTWIGTAQDGHWENLVAPDASGSARPISAPVGDNEAACEEALHIYGDCTPCLDDNACGDADTVSRLMQPVRSSEYEHGEGDDELDPSEVPAPGRVHWSQLTVFRHEMDIPMQGADRLKALREFRERGTMQSGWFGRTGGESDEDEEASWEPGAAGAIDWRGFEQGATRDRGGEP